MLRLTPPEHEVPFQTDRLVATWRRGGNVAVSPPTTERILHVTAAPANPVYAMIKEVRSSASVPTTSSARGSGWASILPETGRPCASKGL